MISSSKIILREKTLAGARNDYTWEMDHELAQLDAAPTVNATFSQYLTDYIAELRHPLPNSYRFAIYTLDDEHIGNCSYYNVSETRGEAELGIMIGNRDYWDKGYGTDTVSTLVDYVFYQTKLNRLYLKTLESNTRAQKCFKKCGFSQYGDLVKKGLDFVLMEIHRDRWQEHKQPSP
ncbi:GNAT family N-acetyltransferase [Chloroflexota bacterium]